MNTQSKSQLFSEISPQAASQTKGGYWAQQSQGTPVTVVVTPVAVASPVATSGFPGGAAQASTINITNPRIKGGSIVNLPENAGTINITNPRIRSGSIVNF